MREWIGEVCERGAGEILLASMDCDGVKWVDFSSN
ncbi:hypothetical protein [Helicobacter mustelae]|nr:hypothetical protein [Helicobacter mustelae]